MEPLNVNELKLQESVKSLIIQ